MPKLRVIDGFLLGETFELVGPLVTVGRAEDNDIVLQDERISRFHCKVLLEGKAALVEDLGSANGTLVNGVAIQRARLLEGDELKVGSHVLSYSANRSRTIDDRVIIIPGRNSPDNTSLEIVTPEPTGEFVAEHMAGAHTPERILRDLALVYEVGNLINSVHDHAPLMRTVLDLAFEAVNATDGFLVLVEDGGRLAVKARRSDSSSGALSIADAVAKLVLKQGRGVLINDAIHDERLSKSDSVLAHHLRSVLCVPLKCQEKVLGLVYLDNSRVACAFSSDDLRLVSAIAVQAAVAIENSRLFRALEDLMFGSIGALVATVEAKDRYIRGHSERVARISRALAAEIELPDDTIKTVQLAALLHDIGKIGISEAILHKEGRLTESEWSEVREHAGRGAEILVNIKDMSEITLAVKHHHESFDGSGYPDGVSGLAVPVASRIIAVADSYDAMTSQRPYRSKLNQEDCVAEIIRCSGTQFDPEAVEALLKCVRKARITALSNAS